MKLNRTPNPLDRNARNGENDNWEKIEGSIKRIDDTVSDLILESGGDSNLEVVQARGGKPVLNDRLVDIETELAEESLQRKNKDDELEHKKADNSYVNNKLNDISVTQINKNKGKLDASYMSEEFLQQMAGNTPIGSVPEDGSVTPEKTTFIKTSKNLLNPKYFVKGKVTNPNTGELTDSSNSCFYKIPIRSTGFYVKNWGNPAQTIFYDFGGDIIEYKNTNPFNIEDGVGFISVNIPGKSYEGLQLERGQESTEYEGYSGLTIEDLNIPEYDITEDNIKDGMIKYYHTDFVEIGKNILDKSKLVTGYVLNRLTGEKSESASNSYYEFIKVTPGETYTLNFNTPRQVLFYEDNNEESFVSGISNESTFTVPNNCHYIRGNIPGFSGDGLQIEKGTESTPYEPFHYRFKNQTSNSNEDSSSLGVKYSLTQDTSDCERIDGLKSVNDLDEVYPFNSIRLCNVSKTSVGATKVTYEDDAEFKRDGSNGQVMVEIPKHYFKRYRKDGYEYIELSGVPKDGFVIDPAFVENGKELNAVYVSAYDGHVSNDKLNSWSGVFPSENISLTQFREYAKNNGKGFGLLDFRTITMLQRLMMVYFASRDSQKAVGEGKTQMIYQTFSAALATNNATGNYIEVNPAGSPTRHFLVGDTVTVNDELWVVENRKITNIVDVGSNKGITFDGDPVEITSGTTKIYHTPQITGETDDMTSHSGSSDKFDKNGHNSVKMFHIENLWGNVWTLIDGVVLDNLTAWIGENMEDYNDDDYKTTYKPLPYSYPEQAANTQDDNTEFEFYIKNLTYDGLNPAYQLPLELGTGGRSSHFSDPWYANDDPNRIPSYGGGWDLWFRAGIFNIRFWQGATFRTPLNGARLIFKDI